MGVLSELRPNPATYTTLFLHLQLKPTNKLKMASNDELACVYAALILADDQVAITSEKLATILKAAGVSVEPYWPGLFSKALEGLNVKELIQNVGSSAGSAPAAGGAAPADAAPLLRQGKRRRRRSQKSLMKIWALD